MRSCFGHLPGCFLETSVFVSSLKCFLAQYVVHNVTQIYHIIDNCCWSQVASVSGGFPEARSSSQTDRAKIQPKPSKNCDMHGRKCLQCLEELGIIFCEMTEYYNHQYVGLILYSILFSLPADEFLKTLHKLKWHEIVNFMCWRSSFETLKTLF